MIRQFGKMFYNALGYYPVKIRGRRFKGTPEHAFFWRILNRGGFEPRFFEMLDRYLPKNSVYCDIGSWIGPTVMYASEISKTVYAIEPDPVAHHFLKKNLEKNRISNVKIFNGAISQTGRRIKMASHGGNIGDSMTSMVNIHNYEETFSVPSVTWSDWLNEQVNEKIDFIKMDIEGGETEVVPTMVDYLKQEKPFFHLSFHGPYLERDKREKQIGELFRLLDFYNKCLDEELNEIEPADLRKQNIAGKFCSYLFMD